MENTSTRVGDDLVLTYLLAFVGTYGGSKHAPVVRITETVDVATDDWEQQSDKKPQVGVAH